MKSTWLMHIVQEYQWSCFCRHNALTQAPKRMSEAIRWQQYWLDFWTAADSASQWCGPFLHTEAPNVLQTPLGFRRTPKDPSKQVSRLRMSKPKCKSSKQNSSHGIAQKTVVGKKAGLSSALQKYCQVSLEASSPRTKASIKSSGFPNVQTKSSVKQVSC